jgi:hypothetical protein
MAHQHLILVALTLVKALVQFIWMTWNVMGMNFFSTTVPDGILERITVVTEKLQVLFVQLLLRSQLYLMLHLQQASLCIGQWYLNYNMEGEL